LETFRPSEPEEPDLLISSFLQRQRAAAAGRREPARDTQNVVSPPAAKGEASPPPHFPAGKAPAASRPAPRHTGPRARLGSPILGGLSSPAPATCFALPLTSRPPARSLPAASFRKTHLPLAWSALNGPFLVRVWLLPPTPSPRCFAGAGCRGSKARCEKRGLNPGASPTAAPLALKLPPAAPKELPQLCRESVVAHTPCSFDPPGDGTHRRWGPPRGTEVAGCCLWVGNNPLTHPK